MKRLRGKIQKRMALAAAALLCVLAACTDCLAPSAAEAASIDFSRKGSITVTLYSEETGSLVTDGTLTIYQVAELSLDDGNMAYTLTEGFRYFEGELNAEAASLASELAAYVTEHTGADAGGDEDFLIEGTVQAIGEDGTVVFQDLDLGLYLMIQTVSSTGYYVIEPFVVTVPYGVNGAWEYDVDASPKTEIETEIETESEPETEAETEPQTETSQTESESGTNTLPQTGQLNWPIPLLAAGGLVLITLGILMARPKNKENR